MRKAVHILSNMIKLYNDVYQFSTVNRVLLIRFTGRSMNSSVRSWTSAETWDDTFPNKWVVLHWLLLVFSCEQKEIAPQWIIKSNQNRIKWNLKHKLITANEFAKWELIILQRGGRLIGSYHQRGRRMLKSVSKFALRGDRFVETERSMINLYQTQILVS